MGPIAHTKGWSGSPQMGPKYSGVPRGGLCSQTCALEYRAAAVPQPIGLHDIQHRLTDAAAKGRPFASAGALFSISPEILKPIRRERRVANRRSNRLVAEIVLDRSGIPPIVGQLVAARVAQHMAADLEREARRLASARNHALVTCHAQGRHALGGEHVAPRLPLPLQAAQGAEFAPTARV